MAKFGVVWRGRRRPTVEVDYEYFLQCLWPRMRAGGGPEGEGGAAGKGAHQRHGAGMSATLVWTEIVSFIKGSAEALDAPGGRLGLAEYEALGVKRSPNFVGRREDVYTLYEQYERLKAAARAYDLCDVVSHIHAQLRAHPDAVPRTPIHEMYVDECQDFTTAELRLLLDSSADPNGLFLTGDTAQTIARGLAFRFQVGARSWPAAGQRAVGRELCTDVASMFFARRAVGDARCGVPKEIHKLTSNYRTHSGVLDLASLVVEVVQALFPSTIDRLPPDRGLFPGPKPWLLRAAAYEDLCVLLLGGSEDGRAQIEFGAQQCVIVRDAAAKARLPADLRYGALVCTVFEAKGLEFEDVLVYNFFKDSPGGAAWRCLVQYQLEHEHKLSDEEGLGQGPAAAAHCGHGVQASALMPEASPADSLGLVGGVAGHVDRESAAATAVGDEGGSCGAPSGMGPSGAARPLEFDPRQHKVLLEELRHLYTAITRARVRVWLYDEDQEARAPAWWLLERRGLVRVVDSVLAEERLGLTRGATTSQEEWRTQGSNLLDKGAFTLAATCFEKGGAMARAAAARGRALASQSETSEEAAEGRGAVAAKRERFAEAARCYLAGRGTPGLPCAEAAQLAAKCLRHAERHVEAARLFEGGGRMRAAAKCWLRAGEPGRAGKLFLQLGRVSDAASAYADARAEVEEGAAALAAAGHLRVAVKLLRDADRPEEAWQLKKKWQAEQGAGSGEGAPSSTTAPSPGAAGAEELRDDSELLMQAAMQYLRRGKHEDFWRVAPAMRLSEAERAIEKFAVKSQRVALRAQLLEMRGRHLDAARVWIEAGELSRAVAILEAEEAKGAGGEGGNNRNTPDDAVAAEQLPESWESLVPQPETEDTAGGAAESGWLTVLKKGKAKETSKPPLVTALPTGSMGGLAAAKEGVATSAAAKLLAQCLTSLAVMATAEAHTAWLAEGGAGAGAGEDHSQAAEAARAQWAEVRAAWELQGEDACAAAAEVEERAHAEARTGGPVRLADDCGALSFALHAKEAGGGWAAALVLRRLRPLLRLHPFPHLGKSRAAAEHHPAEEVAALEREARKMSAVLQAVEQTVDALLDDGGVPTAGKFPRGALGAVEVLMGLRADRARNHYLVDPALSHRVARAIELGGPGALQALKAAPVAAGGARQGSVEELVDRKTVVLALARALLEEARRWGATLVLPLLQAASKFGKHGPAVAVAAAEVAVRYQRLMEKLKTRRRKEEARANWGAGAGRLRDGEDPEEMEAAAAENVAREAQQLVARVGRQVAEAHAHSNGKVAADRLLGPALPLLREAVVRYYSEASHVERAMQLLRKPAGEPARNQSAAASAFELFWVAQALGDERPQRALAKLCKGATPLAKTKAGGSESTAHGEGASAKLADAVLWVASQPTDRMHPMLDGQRALLNLANQLLQAEVTGGTAAPLAAELCLKLLEGAATVALAALAERAVVPAAYVRRHLQHPGWAVVHRGRNRDSLWAQQLVSPWVIPYEAPKPGTFTFTCVHTLYLTIKHLQTILDHVSEHAAAYGDGERAAWSRLQGGAALLALTITANFVAHRSILLCSIPRSNDIVKAMQDLTVAVAPSVAHGGSEVAPNQGGSVQQLAEALTQAMAAADTRAVQLQLGPSTRSAVLEMGGRGAAGGHVPLEGAGLMGEARAVVAHWRRKQALAPEAQLAIPEKAVVPQTGSRLAEWMLDCPLHEPAQAPQSPASCWLTLLREAQPEDHQAHRAPVAAGSGAAAQRPGPAWGTGSTVGSPTAFELRVDANEFVMPAQQLEMDSSEAKVRAATVLQRMRRGHVARRDLAQQRKIRELVAQLPGSQVEGGQPVLEAEPASATTELEAARWLLERLLAGCGLSQQWLQQLSTAQIIEQLCKVRNLAGLFRIKDWVYPAWWIQGHPALVNAIYLLQLVEYYNGWQWPVWRSVDGAPPLEGTPWREAHEALAALEAATDVASCSRRLRELVGSSWAEWAQAEAVRKALEAQRKQVHALGSTEQVGPDRAEAEAVVTALMSLEQADTALTMSLDGLERTLQMAFMEGIEVLPFTVAHLGETRVRTERQMARAAQLVSPAAEGPPGTGSMCHAGILVPDVGAEVPHGAQLPGEGGAGVDTELGQGKSGGNGEEGHAVQEEDDEDFELRFEPVQLKRHRKSRTGKGGAHNNTTAPKRKPNDGKTGGRRSLRQ
ncbi:hypothetical protein CYMTET_42187 [Cymbomonas tetramitiformis]|uniref:UvrD-like helicase ATP-binding domain-containing protein n=1 Tax=Cymbomonas tetramitiformis TaxID=36881 RepID=A0AAE0C5Y1_9CHLO|nr:hypothetical protein CYMTET_42187 [Cymbomonas tetramitiformis]